MSKSRHRHPSRRRGRPRIADLKSASVSPADAPVSLPLPEAGQALTPSVPREVPAHARLSEDSSIKETAIKIYVMRSTGLSDEEIARVLGLSPKTLPGYIYKAGKMGWLDEFLNEPRERLEYSVMHKVVRNIEEGLEDNSLHATSGMKVKTQVALKVAEGALFPRLQQQGGGQTNLAMGIRIEVVGGTPQSIREGTIIEAPAYTVEDE